MNLFQAVCALSKAQADTYKQSAAEFPVENEETTKQEYINQMEDDDDRK